jgi:hypothetical protein
VLKDPVFILSVLALLASIVAIIVSVVAIVVSVILYCKSTRDLKSILDYLQMAINNPNIKPGPGQKGIPRIWNATLRPDNCRHEQVADSPTLVLGEKKPD